MADSSPSKFGYVRRGLLLVLALLALGAILLGAYQWKIYHRNLAVSDANLLPFPALTGKDRILIFSPHPDDETLGAGGLIAAARKQGIPVRVVFLTNGDGSLATRLVQDARFVEQMAKGQDPQRPRNIYRQIAPMRQKEALAALARLNVPANEVTFLGYPDGGTKTMWETNWSADNLYRSPYTKANRSPYANAPTLHAPYCGRQVVDDVKRILLAFKPTLVVTTNPYDTHPDHWAAYAYLSAAVSQLQVHQKYFSWAAKITCYTFLIHHGLWPAPHGYHPQKELAPPADLMQIQTKWLRLPLSAETANLKREALQEYQSQLATTPQFLRGFLRRNELFGNAAGQTETIKDPRNDLLLPKVLSGADITSITARQGTGKVLSIGVNLNDKPWRDVSYIITVHTVTANIITLRKIAVTANKGSWQAVLLSDDHRDLPVHINQHQISVSLPVETPASESVRSTVYLISVASYLHKRALDQTPTQLIYP
jgi:LmbE family N-acetylglucosaminyl deacetylase